MLAPRALLLAAALLALAALSRARRSCNTARYGVQQGREVHIHDQRMSPYAPDWKIIVPPVCERIVGVTATACDADGAPSVYMSSLMHGLVIRDGEISTGAYLYVTVYCDPNELNPELLELLPNHNPSMLRLPSARFRVLSRSANLPWLMGSRPLTSVLPEHLIMLNFPRWPNAHEPDWPEQPVILDVKSYVVPGSTFASPTIGTFTQVGHSPLRHPRLLLSRSPTTEFPGARWAGQAPDPQPEHDHVPDYASDQEETIVVSDTPEHNQSQEQATTASIEPAHSEEQAATLGAEPDHDEGHTSTSAEHDDVQAAAGESDSSENNVMPMSGEPNSDDESSPSGGERHHHFRPLTLVRQIAQWWTKNVHGALRGRRMPRRRVGHGDQLRAGALHPAFTRLERTRPGADRSNSRRRAPLYYWRD